MKAGRGQVLKEPIKKQENTSRNMEQPLNII
jgi:hypothetical protein